MSLQLPLEINVSEDYTFDNFINVDNQQLIQAIQSSLSQDNSSYIYVWGGRSIGKTHLLHATCNYALQQGLTAFYLSFAGLYQNLNNLLNGLEGIKVICLDDINRVKDNKDIQEQVFHLYNRLQMADSKLIIAGDSTPSKLPMQLPDLQSRLCWGETYQLKSLSDEHKVKLLQYKANIRGLKIDELALQFLMRRVSRDLPQLFNLLNKLDKASMSAQRRLTVPFIKQVLDC